MKRMIAAAVLSGAALAAQAADTYEIDPGHTFAEFEYSHFGFSTPNNKFTDLSGTVTLDMAKKTGSVEVTIPVDSVVTGVKKFDDHLKSGDFFEADKYPKITFKSTEFKFSGDKLKEVKGNLTVKDVTKPVTLKVTEFVCKDHPIKKTPACGADAETTIKRSEFGVGAYAPAVSDEVTLRIGVEAHKK